MVVFLSNMNGGGGGAGRKLAQEEGDKPQKEDRITGRLSEKVIRNH